MTEKNENGQRTTATEQIRQSVQEWTNWKI